MSQRGRAARSTVSAGMIVLLVVATLFGSDDWFPFTPMRQYAYAVDPDGRTSTHYVEGIGADGDPVTIPFDAIDMRPAELEGLLGPLETREDRLRDVLATFRANRPDAPETIGIRYLRVVVQLVDRRPTAPRTVELTAVTDS